MTWRRSWRIVPARYPPIALFERVADPADWEALVEIESLTDERVRDEIGDIALVSPGERVSGPGAGWVMAAFTHVGRPSRFSDGTWGVYYTARTRDTAIAETAHHAARFYRATGEPPLEVSMRVLVAGVAATLHDIRGAWRRYRDIHDLEDHAEAQGLARSLRASDSSGIAYDSVRRAGDACVAAFWPRVIRPLPVEEGFLLYHWDGTRIDRIFDHGTGVWLALSGSAS